MMDAAEKRQKEPVLFRKTDADGKCCTRLNTRLGLILAQETAHEKHHCRQVLIC